MKKFLLVMLIGMTLAINLYGVVSKYMTDEIKEVDHIGETSTIVYVE